MALALRTITSEKGTLRGKRVLVRLDLNVPIVDGEVRDDFRIARSLPTLQFLRDEGAKVIIISHIESEGAASLSRVASHIAKSLPLKAFIANLLDAPAVIANMQEGEVVMLENLRKDKGEKENDPVFAAKLANLADLYVFDAFAVAHREHASVVLVPKLLSSFAGPLLVREIDELSKCFNAPKPFVFILGGAKFQTKLPLVERFLGLADTVFIGGALANDVFKEKGLEVGQSVVSGGETNLKHIESNPKLLLPSDVVVDGPSGKTVKEPTQVGADEKILDAGPRAVSGLSDVLSEAAFVLWNGPVGDYEKGFSEGTEGIARAIVESKARSVIGGGDTIAVVAKMGILDKFTFASTGGGAMIDFLAKGTLPGLDALQVKE
jgi:phosphoglycerate kinase